MHAETEGGKKLRRQRQKKKKNDFAHGIDSVHEAIKKALERWIFLFPFFSNRAK